MWISRHFLRIPQIYAVSEGLTMAPYKVQIIQDWPEPRKVKDVQSFLGFTNFYRWFIFGYSEITIPLTCLTRKGTTWHFTNECCSAIEALKKAFTTALVLTHWIPDTQITVETDASDYALAAVLSNYKLKWRTAPDCIPLPNILHPRTQLWCSRQRATHDFWSFQMWRHCACWHWGFLSLEK